MIEFQEKTQKTYLFGEKREHLKLTDEFKDASPSDLCAYNQLKLTFSDHSDFLWK